MNDFNLHRRYAFKPSRIALGFQLFCIAMLFILLSLLLSLWLSILLSIIALMSLIFFRKKAQIESLEQLDLDQWSLKFYHSDQVLSVNIQQWVDHSLYVVVYFQEKKRSNLVIWCDQMTELQWKSLKMRVKLH